MDSFSHSNQVFGSSNLVTGAHLPAVVAAVQKAEAAGGTGEHKFNTVLDEVSGLSGAVASAGLDPRVSAIAVMINVVVSMLKMFGPHKAAI